MLRSPLWASLRGMDMRTMCPEETEGAVSAIRLADPLGEQRASQALWSTMVSGSSGGAGVRSDEVGRLFRVG